MKREGFHHRKFRKLARLLGISTAHARGLAESLWHVTAMRQPRGDIGAISDEDLADEMGEEIIEPAKLVNALVEAGLLDRSKEHRLVVHDWAEHCDNGVRMKLRNRNVDFVVPPAAPPKPAAASSSSKSPAPQPTPAPETPATPKLVLDAALEAMNRWSKADRGHALSASEEGEIHRRLNAMPDEAALFPSAAREARKAGARFKNLSYAATVVLNRIDEMRTSTNGQPAQPATPQAVVEMVKAGLIKAIAGMPVEGLTVKHNPLGVYVDGQLVASSDDLAKGKVAFA